MLADVIAGVHPVNLWCLTREGVSLLKRHAYPHCRMSLCVYGRFRGHQPIATMRMSVVVDDLPGPERGWLRLVTGDSRTPIILSIPHDILSFAIDTLPPTWFTDQTIFALNPSGPSATHGRYKVWAQAANVRRIVVYPRVPINWDVTILMGDYCQEMHCWWADLPYVLDHRRDWKVLGITVDVVDYPKLLGQVGVCKNLQLLFIFVTNWPQQPEPLDAAFEEIPSLQAIQVTFWYNVTTSHTVTRGSPTHPLLACRASTEDLTGAQYVDVSALAWESHGRFYPMVKTVYVNGARCPALPPQSHASYVLQLIEAFPNLTVLRVELPEHVSSACLQAAGNLKHLRSLMLSTVERYDDVLDFLSKLTRLETLNLRCNNIDLETSKDILSGLHRLVHVTIWTKWGYCRTHPDVVMRNRIRIAAEPHLALLYAVGQRFPLHLPTELLMRVVQMMT